MPPVTLFVKLLGTGPDGRLREVGVSGSGALHVSATAVETGKFQAMTTTSPFVFFRPREHRSFCITGIEVKATRSVDNTTAARIVVYEASSATSTTEDRVLYETALVRGEDGLMPPGVRLLVNEGKWVNGKTDDATVNINLFGFYTTPPAETLT